MTHAQAIKIVTEYTGTDLLESLERIQRILDEDRDTIMRAETREAYYTLMAGFTRLLG